MILSGRGQKRNFLRDCS